MFIANNASVLVFQSYISDHLTVDLIVNVCGTDILELYDTGIIKSCILFECYSRLCNMSPLKC